MMNDEKKPCMKDRMFYIALNAKLKAKEEVVLFLVNGVRISGRLLALDKGSVLVSNPINGKRSISRISAIASLDDV